jgi:hypothetical protein
MTKTVIGGLVLLLATQAAVATRVPAGVQDVQETHGASISLPPTELILQCNGQSIRCIQAHSSTAAPDVVYCDLSGLRTWTAPAAAASAILRVKLAHDAVIPTSLKFRDRPADNSSRRQLWRG